jgi:UDP-N-acetylmuramoyl-tripeptide--D-alanyl-D-alanine ligase
MKNMTLNNIATAVNGELFNPNNTNIDDITAKGVVIDSRLVDKDYIFIATKGERVDGHSFIDSVFDKGALGVICEKAPDNPKGAYIVVKDSFQALKDVAEFYRRQLSIKVVGITGSVGKTSTKEFVASVLEQGYSVLKTAGNFNNEVGLPLTVLGIRDNHQIVVLEMGINNFGEMHRLSKIARPDLCLITNIGQCHLENLGTRDGILKAKSEIFDYISENGTICLNGDDDKLSTISDIKGIKPIFFGLNSDNNYNKKNKIYATDFENLGLEGSSATIHIKGDKDISFNVNIPLPGEHMLNNALAATAVGIAFGMDTTLIKKGIETVEPVGGRSHVIKTDKLTLIDDCYNANPVSVKSALDLLSSTKGKRLVAILGDMFELGEDEKALHYEVGSYAASKDIAELICIGDLCRSMYEGARSVGNPKLILHHFDTKEDFCAKMDNILNENDIVLVKASHGMHFEEIIKELA